MLLFRLWAVQTSAVHAVSPSATRLDELLVCLALALAPEVRGVDFFEERSAGMAIRGPQAGPGWSRGLSFVHRFLNSVHAPLGRLDSP